MIATHNIKVNGRWIAAGETYGDPEQVSIPLYTEPAVPETAEEEPVKEAPKPKTTRRKK